MFHSISFIRILKTGFSNFTRNWVLSVAATLVVTITLVIFAILALLFSVANFSVKAIQERVDISVYIKKGLAEERILEIKQSFEQDQLIKEVAYVSAQTALEDFKNRHSGNTQILSALNEVDENPLLATLRVKAKNLESFPKIAENISNGYNAAFIEKLNYNDNRAIIDRLSKILKAIVSVGIGLVAVFSAIAILVMFNTLRLTIFNRREEVEIMRLVGATNWYIRGPFLAEAIFYSISATVVSGILLFFVYLKILPGTVNFISSDLPGPQLINYYLLLGGLFVVAVVLSVISTLLAIRRYLRI